jgi:proton-dependent oligopeptide transporter, POT family
MEQPSVAKAAPLGGRDFLGHPRGLYVLFLAQMWERFSYFGMLALLILYLNQYLKLTQDDASTIFKWYTSAIYFTPLVGAYLASRLLGNKLAVLSGAALMAVGHFLMAFPSLTVLYAALVFLVVGCGLLTPPLTTQVGLLYPPNDPRRDSAYTIFYMGINLGAFISPLLCGWLAENTRGRFHTGFTVAGIGMVIALLTYLLGLRWIVELDQGVSTAASDPGTGAKSEEAIAEVPSALPRLTRLAPPFLTGVGAFLALTAPVCAWTDLVSWDTVIFLELAAVAFMLFGWIAGAVRNGLRDRVLAILLLTVFSIFYWAGAGQSGNAINLWAEQNTDRFVIHPAPSPAVYPEAVEAEGPGDEEPTFWERWTVLFERLPRKGADADKSWGEWWSGLLNPVPTAWFQSVNPLLILLLAPLFAVLWTWLGRRGLNPSIPTKIGLGLVLMSLAFALMMAAGRREAGGSSVLYQGADLPAPLVLNAGGQVCREEGGKEPQPYHAGRLVYDTKGRSLRAVGVFPDLTRDDIAGATAPADFVKKLEELQREAATAAKGPPGWSSQVQLDRTPPGFDLRYAGFGKKEGNKEVRYDPASRTLTTTILLEEKEIKGLRVAAGAPELRSALDELLIKANTHRVSPWWLLGFFLLATLGELCLSPVGMAMVSQLAPARFATMLMGLWLLTFAFGNFLAGAIGQKWGTWTPVSYFLVLLAIVGGAGLLLFALGRMIGAMMHEPEKEKS